jgi:hypothetical protein
MRNKKRVEKKTTKEVVLADGEQGGGGGFVVRKNEEERIVSFLRLCLTSRPKEGLGVAEQNTLLERRGTNGFFPQVVLNLAAKRGPRGCGAKNAP